MTSIRRKDVAQYAGRYRLHIHRFARGPYPEASGGIEISMPVNRFLIPLTNPSGKACFVEDGVRHFTLTPGNAYFIPLNCTARVRLDGFFDFVSIQFTLELYEGIDVFSSFKKICEVPGDRWRELGLRAYELKNPFFASALLNTTVFEFCSNLMEQMTSTEWQSVLQFSDFQQELEYIYSNRKKLAQITVSDLADVRHFSREYFTRIFIRNTGCAPKQFLTGLLLNETKRMLSQENLTLKEISDKLGFSSEFYFSKFCRKNIGMPPRLYRFQLAEK